MKNEPVQDVKDFIAAHADEYSALARDIWEHPEPAYEEERSSALHRGQLAAKGFRVTEFPEMKYSFVAESGKGRPILALMGEYDALPGMSQDCSTTRKPLVEGGPGHACGHNLLGVGSLAAAVALAEAAKAEKLSGTIRYYGCPAEEALGRIPLVRAGRFDDVDAALTWHPADVNTPHRYATSANLALSFAFAGRASHAALAPQVGRSALDAVQLMNLGIEFLREHVDRGIMLHYVITEGGQRPNIVPARAVIALYIRGPRAEELRATFKRVLKIARGAALMTETAFEWKATHGKCDFIPNDSLHDSILESMREIPLPAFDEAEKVFAKALAATIDKRDRGATLSMIGAPASLLKGSLHRAVGDYGQGYRIGGSLDVGDVSYIVPTGQMNAAVWPLGVGAHTWQSAAASGSTLAFKGMLWAASVLATTGLELLVKSELLAAAKTEHRKKTRPWRSTMDL
jgi:aminobenzoyl-glutamate utilization protein B